MKRTQFIVLTTYGQENVLGYINPQQPNVIGILHASPLRGAVLNDRDGWTYLPTDTTKFRPATLKDFADFRVSYGGFDNPTHYEPLAA